MAVAVVGVEFAGSVAVDVEVVEVAAVAVAVAVAVAGEDVFGVGFGVAGIAVLKMRFAAGY